MRSSRVPEVRIAGTRGTRPSVARTAAPHSTRSRSAEEIIDAKQAAAIPTAERSFAMRWRFHASARNQYASRLNNPACKRIGTLASTTRDISEFTDRNVL
jgi:hypothetical protein